MSSKSVINSSYFTAEGAAALTSSASILHTFGFFSPQTKFQNLTPKAGWQDGQAATIPPSRLHGGFAPIWWFNLDFSNASVFSPQLQDFKLPDSNSVSKLIIQI